jgi:hypothetical protein
MNFQDASGLPRTCFLKSPKLNETGANSEGSILAPGMALADRISYTLLRWKDAWDGADLAEVSELCRRKLWQDFKRGVGTGGLDDSVRASVTSAP